jgi:hypothetical protein
MSRSHEPSSRWPKPPRSRPLALRAEDFDALGARHPVDLQRRMDAWASGISPRLANLGIKTTPAAPADAAALPRVQFVVRGATRDATRLVLAMDGARVRAGLELPASQAPAARLRLSAPGRALELATALEALPEQFIMGVLDGASPASPERGRDQDGASPASPERGRDQGDAAGTEASRATAHEVRALLERVERQRETMWIGWSVPRDLAVEHAALLDELLADAIVALAKVFALLAADVVVGRAARQEGDARGAKGRRLSRRRIVVDGSMADDDERDRGHAGGRHAHGHDPERERERQPEGDKEEPESLRETTLGRSRLEAKLPSRPGSRRRPSKASSDAIERGTRVHVLKGPFSGKVGVVHELDGKGGARVMLGLLAVRLEVTNLVPAVEGRGRPRLSSSHRKPIPARS